MAQASAKSLTPPNDTASGTARSACLQAWYDVDRAVPLPRWLGDSFIKGICPFISICK